MKPFAMAVLAVVCAWAMPAGATPMYWIYAISGYAMCESGPCGQQYGFVSYNATVLFDPMILPTMISGLPVIQTISESLDFGGKGHSSAFSGVFQEGDPNFPIQTGAPFLYLYGGGTAIDAHFAVIAPYVGPTVGALHFSIGSASYGIEHGTFIATAVPGAATWAMMMVGLGVVGGSLRRRPKVSTRVSFA